MHATIQKPLDEIISYLGPGEKVFVVGCGNCAAKCHSGGEPETKEIAERLRQEGVEVAGWACTGSGVSLCKLAITKKMLNEEHQKNLFLFHRLPLPECYLLTRIGCVSSHEPVVPSGVQYAI